MPSQHSLPRTYVYPISQFPQSLHNTPANTIHSDHQHLNNPPPNPKRTSKRTLPPPHPALLPRHPLRAPPNHHPRLRPRPLRPHNPHPPAQPKRKTLRRSSRVSRHPQPLQLALLACCERDKQTRIPAHSTLGGSCVYSEGDTAADGGRVE